MTADFRRFAGAISLALLVAIASHYGRWDVGAQEQTGANAAALANIPPLEGRLPWIWKEQRTLVGHRSAIWCATFSPDDQLLITGSTGHQGPAGELKIWDVATGRELKSAIVKTKSSGSVRSVSFLPDGKSFVTAEHDKAGAAHLRDAATAQVIRSFVGHKRSIDTLAISSDGERLATTSNDGTVIIWNVKTGELIHTLEGHQGEVYPVAFSEQGRLALSGDSKGIAILWDAETGKLLHTLRGHQKAVQVTAFSKDGKTLVTGSWDETLKLWDAATGAELATLRGHQNGVIGMALSRDGRMLATSSGPWGNEGSPERAADKSDGQVILWDFAARKPLANLHGHKDNIFGIAFTSDGKTLATTGFDKQVKFWHGFQATKAAAPLTARDLENLWDQLASEDYAQLNAAVELLGGMPEQSLPFLRERLRAAAPPKPQTSVVELIGQLSHEQLKVREMASVELSKLGMAARPQIQIALEKSPTVEARRRLNRLLADLPTELTNVQKRLQYAVIAIELSATSEAYAALAELSEDVAGGLVAEEAAAGLKRRALVQK